MWFRRDLRLGDNPALMAACATGGEAGVLPLFCVDPALWGPAGPSRLGYLTRSLLDLDAALHTRGGRLTIAHGDPVHEVVRVARSADARTVYVAEDFGPYGAARDARVEEALAEHGIELARVGSPYAIPPGRVVNGTGRGYQVFTPFSKAWADHGWPAPVEPPGRTLWLSPATRRVPEVLLPDGLELPEAGEEAALRRWREFLYRVAEYDTDRNRPGTNGTSRMSVHLKWGEIHPRTMLADLGRLDGPGAAVFRNELAWREFYADVLWRWPASAREYLRPELARMEYDEPGAQFTAWQEGQTGYPVVDAGMRQLRATGWMHNRARMIAASFLVKDLHVEWQHGARHFMRWLVDGDLASNQHGWQWVAGSGTDAAPYFRVFNPTTQGRRFDPDGDYVRRWVTELADVRTRWVHEPVNDPGGLPDGYPEPIVDHHEERREALARLARTKK
jgi:deoxyribodipyrimidine photo-lyase